MAEPLRKHARRVLGHNARSLYYSNANHPTNTLAHHKLATKKLLQKAGLPTPRLYATFRSRQELAKFRWTKLPSSFVVKPNRSFGGSGVLVIFGRNKKGNWVKADKTEVFIPQLRSHVLDILDGSFSTAHAPDLALFEQRVKNHPDLKRYSPQGIPDIRIVVYNHVPVMAMLRLSTIQSQGRANLHAGGIGVGIDLGTGVTTTAIAHGQLIEHLPGTKLPLAGLPIPHWPDILLIAATTAQVADVPFTGVDIAIDRDDGPLVLEINARPGLDIQLANLAPLRSRLQRVEDLTVATPAKGVTIGTNLFGTQADTTTGTNQTILGATETVTILDQHGQPHQLTAKVDTGAWRTALDDTIATKLGLSTKVVNRSHVKSALGHQERPIIELTLKLRQRTTKTNVYLADRSHLAYPMIIGRRDLAGFLVDPTQNTPRTESRGSPQTH